MSEIEYTQGICHDGAAILANGEMLTIEQVLQELRMCEHLKTLIKCPNCNGVGALRCCLRFRLRMFSLRR